MSSKTHAVCIPYPAQSHIKAMQKFAKILHDKGIYVTFVNTQHNHNRFLKSGGLSFLQGLSDFKFETIPDGLPSSDGESPRDLEALSASITVNFLGPFMNLVRKLESPEIPPVSCIVSDGFLGFSVDTFRWCFYGHFQLVVLWGFIKSKSSWTMELSHLKMKVVSQEEFLNTIVDWVPGKKFMRFRDLSSYARTTNTEEIIFKLTTDAPQKARRASANILHTFRELEPSVFNFLSSIFSRLYTIGPLELLLNTENDAVKSNGYSMWKEEPQCLEWLSSKKPNFKH